MFPFGQRLREERLRLGLSQDQLAEIGGVQRRTQHNYEKGERAPDGVYLAKIAGVGADILYVLTARYLPKEVSLDSGEREIVDAYRQLDDSDKTSVQRLILGLLTIARST